MGGVALDPNIQKESVRVNFDGDVIDPKTKQVIKKQEADYVPPTDNPARIESDSAAPKQDHVSTPSPLAQAIKEQVQAAVKDSIKDINIKEMVDQAIKEAFK